MSSVLARGCGDARDPCLNVYIVVPTFRTVVAPIVKEEEAMSSLLHEISVVLRACPSCVGIIGSPLVVIRNMHWFVVKDSIADSLCLSGPCVDVHSMFWDLFFMTTGLCLTITRRSIYS